MRILNLLKLKIAIICSLLATGCRNTVSLNPKLVADTKEIEAIQQQCQDINLNQNFKYLDDVLNQQLYSTEKFIAEQFANEEATYEAELESKMNMIKKTIEQMKLVVDQNFLDPKYELEVEWKLFPADYKNKSERMIGVLVRFEKVQSLQLIFNGSKVDLNIASYTELRSGNVNVKIKNVFSLFDLCYLNKTTKAVLIVTGKKFNLDKHFIAVLNFPLLK